MVLGAVIVYSFNSDLVVRGVAALVSGRPKTVPVARIALSYPSRRPFRTAINLTIFGLVLFTIVGIATIGSSVQVGVNNSIQAESGGYPLFAYSQTPVPNFPGVVANNSTLHGEIATVVPLGAGDVSSQVPGYAGPWVDTAFAGPAGLPSSETLEGTAQFNFTATENELGSGRGVGEPRGRPERRGRLQPVQRHRDQHLERGGPPDGPGRDPDRARRTRTPAPTAT